MDIKEYIASGILEQYCLGLTSEEESKEVEYMAHKYPEIGESLRQLCEGVEAYARAHAIAPPERLRKKVLENFDEESPSARPKSTMDQSRLGLVSPVFRIAATIALLVLAGLAFSFYQNQEKGRKEMAALSQQVKKLQKDYRQLDSSHEELQQKYVLLKDVGTHHVRMVGSEHAPKAQCVLYWNPEHKGAYLNIVNLPPPPLGHQYQIWADVEGHHHNMGLINMAAANPDSSFLHPLPYIENSQGFVITLETSGGSKHPTVEKLFVKGNL